eukprot:TRINITY_DN21_c0_g3_i1.p1 TRINITY_DN21_c0_g3~~TRINITY_DN21_c0_g3_i1.p1  ORF type:complete len:1621 (+),score=404.04 TRINITY_DN21_c0_g3_i1:32-4894(+)
MSTVSFLFVVLFVVSAYGGADFMLYSPTNTGTGAIMSSMGRSFVTVTASQWPSLTVADFKSYKAIVFGDPTCSGSPSTLPSTNLANLYAAVTGNVLVIGTDEIFHKSQGGSGVVKSGLNFVASASGTGLYVSLACYYHGVSPTYVNFLAPLSSGGKSFQVTGVGCYNDAHIVATSPAIAGLTDSILSNWSCSVHEAFSQYPPEFIPLVIARNAPGSGTLSFADGTKGIPYIMVRGETVSPIKCGDGVVASPEECDSGVGCTVKCVCADGYEKQSPAAKDCKAKDYCAIYGYSGRTAYTKSCVNVVGGRTITCMDGYYPSTHAVGGNQAWVTLMGATAFGGCTLINTCTTYGFSGKSANTKSCVPSGTSRIITCNDGYRAEGSSGDATPTVTLAGSAAFLGCTLIDNCKVYGYSGKPDNAIACSNGVNTRTVTCAAGYAAVAPTTASVLLTGSAAFGGCKLIDTCAVYGYSGDVNVASCKSAVNSRTVTCKDGYWAQAETLTHIGLNASNYAGNVAFVKIDGNGKFMGCSPICGNGKVDTASPWKEVCDGGAQCTKSCTCNVGYEPLSPATTACTQTDNCAVYGWNKDAFVEKCTNGVNIRTITCKAGYYAKSSDAKIEASQLAGAIPSITLTSPAAFAGCALIDNCKQYGWGGDSQVIKCDNGVNTRKITCAAGWWAQSATANGTQYVGNLASVDITGSGAFLGCKPICGNGKVDADNKEECDAGAQCKDCKCNIGYQPASPLTISCALTDNCAKYGWSSDPNFLKCDNGVNIRTITCKAGYYAKSSDAKIEASQLAGAIPSITLTSPAAFAGCALIDNCKQYGWGGDSQVIKCDNGVNTRKITCAAGWWAQSATANGTQYVGNLASVDITGSGAFLGCKPICGNGKVDADNKEECDAGAQCKDCKCNIGYQPSSPLSVSCTLTNNCEKYGWNSDPFFSKCDNGVNIRTITCKAGYWASSTDPAVNRTQLAGAIPSITLTGDARFAGCLLVDNCDLYKWSDDPKVTKCVNGVDQRTITCAEGWWAQSAVAATNATQYDTASSTVVVAGKGAFQGCKIICGNGKVDGTKKEECDAGFQCKECKCNIGYEPSSPLSINCILTDNCKKSGWSNDPFFDNCKNGVNQRTITCKPGYYAQSSNAAINATQHSGAKPSITLVGTEVFAGCALIDNCKQYGWSEDKAVMKCDNGVNHRNVTCVPGYYAQAAENNLTQYLLGIATATVVGDQKFLGCVEIDMCRLHGFSEDPMVEGCSTSINERFVSCKVGWVVKGTDNSRGISLTGGDVFPGCVPHCGDGLLVGDEACDDSNVEEGDGCSPVCTIEEGFDCGAAGNIGLACCSDLHHSLVTYGLKDSLTCWNSYWISSVPGSTEIVFNNQDLDFVLSEDLRLCGRIIIGLARKSGADIQEPNRAHTVVVNGPATVYGTVTVNGGGSIFFDPTPALNSSLTIAPHCQLNTTEHDNNEVQFTMAPGSGIGITNVTWTQEEELAAGAFVRLTRGCATLDGDFWFQAVEIPTKSNVFPLISTQEPDDLTCVDQPFSSFGFELPGSSCSELELIITNEQEQNARINGTVTLFGITNYKHLCNWHIGLISGSIGAVAVGAAAAGAAVLAGAFQGPTTLDYVAL